MPDDMRSQESLVEDVEYRRYGDRALLARLYRPQGTGPFPAVVEVHGGAWVNGDRLAQAVTAEHLAANGILVMSIDFRMPPEAGYPASLQDINYAIRWLKAHAAAYGSQPELVGGLGGSSGGHQLLLSALRPWDPRYAAHPQVGDHDASLNFAIACWPVADPLRRYHYAKERAAEQMVANHDLYWPDEAAMEEGNPHLALTRGESVDLPPVLVIQGTEDQNLPYDMALDFAAAYKARGGSIHAEIYEGQPHGFIEKEPAADASRHALALIVKFIKEQAR